MKSFLLFLLIKLVSDFIQVSTNEDIFFDLFSSNIDNDQEGISSINNSSNMVTLANQFEITSSNSSNNSNASNSSSYILNNFTYPISNELPLIKTNFKLKKQKLFFGKKLLLWKRNTQRGYGAFLMLCEPDITCVTPQTKLAIANCMNSGGSALANQLYNSCSNQNRIQCTDQDVARRLLGCLRLQSANNVLITPQSRGCVRQVVTLGTLDCFVRILRQKPKYRLGTRYSTISTDSGAGVTAAGMGEGNIDGVEDPDTDAQNNARRLETRKLIKRDTSSDDKLIQADYENQRFERIGLIENLLNDTKTKTVLDLIQEPIQSFVTLSYDEDIFSDLNRTSNDNYYGELNDNENDSFNDSFDEVLELKNNLASNETVEESDEFDEVDSEEDEDDSLLTTNSTEVSSTVDPTDLNLKNNVIKLVNLTHLNNTPPIISLKADTERIRSKRQCRSNRRQNRRWPTATNKRRNRTNRRSHFDNFKETPVSLNEGENWELVERRRLRG